MKPGFPFYTCCLLSSELDSDMKHDNLLLLGVLMLSTIFTTGQKSAPKTAVPPYS